MPPPIAVPVRPLPLTPSTLPTGPVPPVQAPVVPAAPRALPGALPFLEPGSEKVPLSSPSIPGWSTPIPVVEPPITIALPSRGRPDESETPRRVPYFPLPAEDDELLPHVTITTHGEGKRLVVGKKPNEMPKRGLQANSTDSDPPSNSQPSETPNPPKVPEQSTEKSSERQNESVLGKLPGRARELVLNISETLDPDVRGTLEQILYDFIIDHDLQKSDVLEIREFGRSYIINYTLDHLDSSRGPGSDLDFLKETAKHLELNQSLSGREIFGLLREMEADQPESMARIFGFAAEHYRVSSRGNELVYTSDNIRITFRLGIPISATLRRNISMDAEARQAQVSELNDLIIACPTITQVTLPAQLFHDSTIPNMEMQGRIPALALVKSIAVHGGRRDNERIDRQLLQSVKRWFPAVERLELHGDLSLKAMECLVAAYPNLRELDLKSNLDDTRSVCFESVHCLRVLVESNVAKNLRKFECELDATPESSAALRDAEFPKLELLHLIRTGKRVLDDVSRMKTPQLTSLALEMDIEETPEAFDWNWLTQLPSRNKLESLFLSGFELPESPLANHKSGTFVLPSLRSLEVEGDWEREPHSDRLLEVLECLCNREKLRMLRLGAGAVGVLTQDQISRIFGHASRSPLFDELRVLRLETGEVPVETLLGSPLLKRIEKLDVTLAVTSDDALARSLFSLDAPELRQLRIGWSQQSINLDAGLVALLRNVPRLSSFSMNHHRETPPENFNPFDHAERTPLLRYFSSTSGVRSRTWDR